MRSQSKLKAKVSILEQDSSSYNDNINVMFSHLPAFVNKELLSHRSAKAVMVSSIERECLKLVKVSEQIYLTSKLQHVDYYKD